MIPKIDKEIGMQVYSTTFKGCGGSIKKNIDDFVVNEIISEDIKSMITNNNGYSLYKLKKQNIDTNHALNHIFKKYRIRLKSLGLKDARGITEQYVSTTNKIKAPDKIFEKKYTLKKICLLSKQINKRHMIANKFQIKITNPNLPIITFTEYKKILNFFGYQRFGSKRPVTHLIGKALLQKEFSKAITILLSYTSEYDTKENTEIRKKMNDKHNYAKCVNEISHNMDLEKIILKEMIKHEDPLKSLRALPLIIRRFFIQAYQSFIFNKTLSIAMDENESLYKSQYGDVCFNDKFEICKYNGEHKQKLAIPIIGYAYYNKTRFHEYIKQILKEEEIKPRDFFVDGMQEISSEGGFRNAVINCYEQNTDTDVVKFTLTRGCFATIILREIIKPSDPIRSGF